MRILPYPSDEAERRLAAIAGRQLEFNDTIFETVRRILADVRLHGDEALVRYAREFDSPDLTAKDLRVTEAEFAGAEALVSPEIRAALDRAATHIEDFHRRQIRQSWITTDRPGTLMGQMIRPVASAGIYVPGAKGGETPLASTVLMNAIPAKVAGVSKIRMVTPATREGKVNPVLLVAARRVGVDEVYKVGSAWAVGALAHGTATIPKCDVIVGPGNIYVTVAKKIVSGTVGIDMIAGPSEVLVVADAKANPAHVAADMLSQAEHDAMASAILITDSPDLAAVVDRELERQTALLARRHIVEASLRDYGAILVVESIGEAMRLANRVAPEHLELLVESPFEWLDRVENAGAVFLGGFTPEPLGDYVAGPNHVLPTAGTARFSSALSVDTFIKKISVLHYGEAAFRQDAPDVLRLAGVEGLGAHAASVAIRLGHP